MSKVQTLRAFVKQRLTSAAEEIFEVFERSIAEYEEELCRQRKLLDAVLQPEVRLHTADVQLLLLRKEELPPEQQQWSPSLEQEEPPQLPHIKEEQEELWSSQEGERLPGPEEAHGARPTSAPVAVKSEDEDEDEAPSSRLHGRQSEEVKAECDGDECGGSEAARSSDPDPGLRADPEDQTSDSEPDTDDRRDTTRKPQSGSDPLQSSEVPEGDAESQTAETLVSSSECATNFLQKHTGIQTGLFDLSVCDETRPGKNSVTDHMKLHSEQKRFSCSVCKKTFQRKEHVRTHMRIHTGEKPFSCSFCGKGFPQKVQMREHMRIHTGEKPFSCSVCGRGFAQSSTLTSHLRVHTGEKPFSCSVCEASFSGRSTLSQHMRIHTGEKPFSCSVCDKRFTQLAHFRKHRCVGENSRNK